MEEGRITARVLIRRNVGNKRSVRERNKLDEEMS